MYSAVRDLTGFFSSPQCPILLRNLPRPYPVETSRIKRRPEPEADHSLPSRDQVNNSCGYCHHTEVQFPVFIVADVSSIAQFRSTGMFLLLITKHQDVEGARFIMFMYLFVVYLTSLLSITQCSVE
jgi:hypothetical protein